MCACVCVTCGQGRGISTLSCAWTWIPRWAPPLYTSPVADTHPHTQCKICISHTDILKAGIGVCVCLCSVCVCACLTLMNWGLANRTVATKHTWSSNAGCRERCSTPSKPFLVALGTRGKPKTEKETCLFVCLANSYYWVLSDYYFIFFHHSIAFGVQA